MNKFKFILSSFISCLIEYSLVFLISYLISKNLKFCIILVSSLFIVATIIYLIGTIIITKPTVEKENINNKETIISLVNKANDEYNLNLKVSFADIGYPNPAASFNNIIWVNPNSNSNKDFLEALVSHEIGHYISGISSHTYFPSIKPFSMISRILFFMPYAACKNHNIKVLDKIFFGLYFVTSITNVIFVFPFFKKDELTANCYAVKLGWGQELRTYYQMVKESGAFNDLMHPSTDVMIDELTKLLKLQGIEKDLYYAHDTLYYAYPKTKTLYLNDNIRKVNNIDSDTLIKISSNVNVDFSRCAINCPNLDKLIFPNSDYKNIRRLTLNRNASTIIYKEE